LAQASWMVPEEMGSLHIEPHQHDNARTHEQRQVDSLETAIRAVVDNFGIERKAVRLPPGNELQLVRLGDLELVVSPRLVG
jgi:hypothetical protein